MASENGEENKTEEGPYENLELDEDDEPEPSLGCCLAPWRRSGALSLSSRAAPKSTGATHADPVDPPAPEPSLRSVESSADESHYETIEGDTGSTPSIVTQIDYVNFLIPHLKNIIDCPFYFGKIDRYEAEALLENKPEGAFLLRDSAQDEFVFSVSFRRYNRSLHARIEESKHRFSFDCHDPGVHSSESVTGLLENYKDPLNCMFFEPMLLHPVVRRTVFSLQDMARAVVCDNCTYNGVSLLPMPKSMKDYLRDYNYKHKIRSRHVEVR